MIVYLLLNTVNSKGYVGQHEGNEISTRWNKKLTGANAHLESAKKKYGEGVFCGEVLRFCTTQEEMDAFEKLWIVTLRTYDPNYGYNMKMGGRIGGAHTPESIRKLKLKRRACMRICYYCFNSFDAAKKANSDGSFCSPSCRAKSCPHPKRTKPHWNKNKTNIELFGEQKAEELRIKNSMNKKDKICITNGIQMKFITKESLLPTGWRRGRSLKSLAT